MKKATITIDARGLDEIVRFARRLSGVVEILARIAGPETSGLEKRRLARTAIRELRAGIEDLRPPRKRTA